MALIDLPQPAANTNVERLADILMILQRCFMLRLSGELSRGQVSFVQFFLLGHISSHEMLSMSEIAEKMSHSTAAATGLVDRLENLGYVQRTHAASDRRKVFVKITKRGAELVESTRQDIIQNLNQCMTLLTPDEQHAWLSIYEKILNYCQNKPDSCSK